MSRTNRWSSVCAVLLIAAVIAGCKQRAGEGQSEVSAAPSGAVPEQSIMASVPPSPVIDRVSAPPADDKPGAVEQRPVQKAAGKPEPSPGEAAQDVEPYTNDKPRLMGLMLSDKQDRVAAKYGKAAAEYVMDDPAEPITVWEYPDFTVGFNESGELQFVELVSGTANSGLNGLTLGQSTDAVYKALGKPDTSTNYVFAYKTNTSVLKLDIDPKTKTVQSVKLFARTDSQ